MSGTIPQRDQKILCTRSGNRCALPKCHKELVINKTESDRESLIGEMAHIKGEKPEAPRYDDSMTDKQRNAYDNLIFVCTSCHKMIDDQPNTYTVEKLHE
ncbi:MAG: HNH endonuclease, partial [Alphaproteobacteria bacterium]